MARSNEARTSSRWGRRLGIAALAVLGLAIPSAAHAQRGGDFVVQKPAADSPRKGFPGALNTHMPEEGSTVGSFPLLQVDHGLTENLSLGVNLIPTLPALSGEIPGGLGRLRYRLYDDGTLSSVASIQGGYMPIRTDDPGDPDRLWGLYASVTVGLQLSSRQRLAATALGATLRVDVIDYHEHYQLDALGLALDYEVFAPNERLGLSLTALGIPLLASSVDAPGASASMNFHLGPGQRVTMRAAALLRAGRKWLFEAGGVAPLSLSTALPWLGITRRW